VGVGRHKALSSFEDFGETFSYADSRVALSVQKHEDLL
jgi:hypothetical protein